MNFRSNEFFKPNNSDWYAKTLSGLFENPGCIGFHLCGAYQRNKARRRGLLDEMEKADAHHVERMSAANEQITLKMAETFKD